MASLAQEGQGQGWSSDTAAEVSAVLRFVPNWSDPLVLLDVGANVGDWTNAVLDSGRDVKIYAFEPDQKSASQFEHRFAAEPRVELARIALGAKTGSATLWADTSGSSLASLSRRRMDSQTAEFDHSQVVAVVELDNWCAENGIRPDVLKIDVEGHELDVLKGARRTLGTANVVQFEFGGTCIDSRVFFRDLYDLLDQAGYALWRMGPKGTQPVGPYTEDEEVFRFTNYIAVNRVP